MKIIVQSTSGDAYPLDGKSGIQNKTLSNIKSSLLLNSSYKKELWCLDYQYDIWISRPTYNWLRVDVTYFFWHVSRPAYKHIKI